jgi:soluble lytic murein transglycosylase-like protein
MISRNFPRVATALALLAGCVCGAAAWGDAAGYLHVRRSVQQVLLPTGMLGAIEQQPADYLGKAVEVKATVSGLVVSGTTKTALLAIGDDSVCAVMPPHLKDTLCVESGNAVRAILSVKADRAQATGASIIMLAVAPEAEAAQADRMAAVSEPAGRSSLPSRSMDVGMTRAEAIALANVTPTGDEDDGQGAPVAPLSERARSVYGAYRTFVRKMNKNLTESDVDKITTSILYFSDVDQIDPRLVVATIIAESGFDPTSTSNKGAMGLGQLMPSTAAGLNVSDPYDPVQNIAASVHILRGHLDEYGGAPPNAGIIPFDQIKLVMAAYNAGSGAVRKYHGVPPYPETQRYVARVAALYQQMCGATK